MSLFKINYHNLYWYNNTLFIIVKIQTTWNNHKYTNTSPLHCSSTPWSLYHNVPFTELEGSFDWRCLVLGLPTTHTRTYLFARCPFPNHVCCLATLQPQIITWDWEYKTHVPRYIIMDTHLGGLLMVLASVLLKVVLRADDLLPLMAHHHTRTLSMSDGRGEV